MNKNIKDNIIAAIMTITMLSVIGFAVTLFAGAFFVKALGVDGVLYLAAAFLSVALVGKCVTDKMEGIQS